MVRRLTTLLCAAVILCGVAAAGKKAGYWKKPGTAEVPNFTVVPAADKCSNWGWAAATETLLALDQVKVDQHLLVSKAYGGELCDDAAPKMRALADAVNGDYVVNEKLKMRVVTRVVPAGAPIAAEDLIAAIHRGRPMILFWKARAYLAVGAAFDEYIGPNGTRLWDVRELTLLDPAAEDEEHRRVTFNKDRDGIAEIGGAMEFVVMRMEEIDWQH
ncbi:MAG: hypothetical protein HYX28_05175 [Candidatus Koribacter versatilis]|uniref:Uncharacterized protein n=1 Tax=Candidatus Korobacter versatilis TaxID=658062 RepID=A0A932A8S2_9BACT|nr:hypothetical protein [Candidatus Koribacter versatilis]